ncbi:helix-turn-helix transcriptional regulator [Rufibacter aurantiacus]|uniref:helix-turn-helix transcriptional regulator n=1 Tax=Rufibacter aurantiacus TaxID=2817374 RepID=UPI001B30A18D|nr:helix-turn-helix transcriptional regulator [Rufibacter aurantiacus]
MKNCIKEARMRKQLTQAQLAELVQVSRQTIISIETNKYLPSTVLALKLAKALQQRVEDLFELEDSD